jgi:hypothetical protein
VLISVYQSTIQQCFSLTTNQHRPESANQKPSGEQVTRHEVFTHKCPTRLRLETLSNVLLASPLSGAWEKLFRVLELNVIDLKDVVDVTNIIDPSLGAAAPLAPAALLHNAAQHQHRAGNGTGPVLLP